MPITAGRTGPVPGREAERPCCVKAGRVIGLRSLFDVLASQIMIRGPMFSEVLIQIHSTVWSILQHCNHGTVDARSDNGPFGRSCGLLYYAPCTVYSI